jgi:hypothetical protein
MASTSPDMQRNIVPAACVLHVQNCRSNDNWCYANCKRDCGGIDIEKCKRYGQDVGYNAAKTACELTTVSMHKGLYKAPGMGCNPSVLLRK